MSLGARTRRSRFSILVLEMSPLPEFLQLVSRAQGAYIDTGKLRYILREVSTDPADAAAVMLARCVAKDDRVKYFDTVRTLFRQQDTWNVARPLQL